MTHASQVHEPGLGHERWPAHEGLRFCSPAGAGRRDDLDR